MTPEDELLIICARQDFSEEHRLKASRITRDSQLNWDTILSAAIEQGIAPLLHANLLQCSPPDILVPAEVVKRIQLSAVKAVALHGSRAAGLEKLLAFLNSRGIQAMLIKGIALEILVYDRPWLTTANDIDIILRINPAEFADEDQAQFESLTTGLSLEYDFIEHHDVTMNGILPVDFQRVWADASPIIYRGQSCLIMSAEDMLITLCINSCRKRYFRLKSLLDIAETIQRCPDIRWQEVSRKARAYQCNHMVYTALLSAQATLDCQLPTALLGDLEVSSIRSRLISSWIEKSISHPLFVQEPTRRILGRAVGTSLTLPYLSYRWDQLIRRAWFVWRTRDRPMGLIEEEQD
jgi:hypothetical protein